MVAGSHKPAVVAAGEEFAAGPAVETATVAAVDSCR